MEGPILLNFSSYHGFKYEAKIAFMKNIILLLIPLLFTACKNDSTRSEVPVGEVITNLPVETGGGGTQIPVNQTWTEEFMDLVNAHRTNLGLRSLIQNEDMGEIARIHSQNMASGTVAFGHTGFSLRCTQSKTALGGGNWCGENVAMGQKTPEAAFNAWMNSSGHRANIEQARATHTGFGYSKSSSGQYYWTQIFLEY